MTHPCICRKCGHNMGRSRVKLSQRPLTVRCNKCKTVYELHAVDKNGKVVI